MQTSSRNRLDHWGASRINGTGVDRCHLSSRPTDRPSHAKYGLPPHKMTSKAINDIKKFSAAERKHWLEIKANDMNASKKRESAAVGSKANKKKRVSGGD